MRAMSDHAEVTSGTALLRAGAFALCVSSLLAFTPASVCAQQPAGRSPMDPAAALSQALSQMGPMYEQMTQSTIDGTLKAMERPENVERMAVFARRYYDALIKQGFSPEEALQITAGAGNPAARFGR